MEPKQNPPFFSPPDSSLCGGVQGRVQGRVFFTSCIFSPPSHLFFMSATRICSPTAFVCCPPAFEDGAGGVSREDARGRCLRRALGVLGESVGILCSGRMLGSGENDQENLYSFVA